MQTLSFHANRIRSYDTFWLNIPALLLSLACNGRWAKPVSRGLFDRLCKTWVIDVISVLQPIMCYSWHRSFKYSFIFKVIRSLKNVPTWIMIVSSTSLQQWQALDDRGMHKTLHKMTIRLADNTVLHGPTQRLFFSFFTFFSFLDENRSDQNPSFWNWKNGFQKKIRVWMRMAL